MDGSRREARMPTLSELTFDYLRRHWSHQLLIAEAAIRLDVPLEWYVPKERRREFWDEHERQLGLRMPELHLTPLMEQAGWCLSGAAAVRGLVLGLLLAVKWIALPLAIVSFLLTANGYFRWTRRWATEHPEIQTFGDLSRWILARNVKHFRRKFGIKPNRDEIFAAVKAVLVESLGVEPREVTMDARFVDILGC